MGKAEKSYRPDLEAAKLALVAAFEEAKPILDTIRVTTRTINFEEWLRLFQRQKR